MSASPRSGRGVVTKGTNGKAPPPVAARAELRVRPTVQGAAVVLENKTGRILAMAGGFSYPLSQLNRVTQSQRQPGSAIKPLSYLAALAKGLQPNTLVRDEPITLPPIGGVNARTRQEDYWTPKNYDGGACGIMTLRRALENFAQPRDRQPAGGRHRHHAGAQPRPHLRAGAWRRRSTRTACATIRSCWARSRCGRSIWRRSSPPSPTRACGRRRMRSKSIEQDGKVDLPPRRRVGGADRLGRRRRRSISSRRCCRASCSAAPPRASPAWRLCRRQDRHHRRRERRLVRRLHQRGHGRGLGRLRQCRRQAPHARRRRDRRQRRGADLRADHPGGLGAPRAADGAARAVAGDPQVPGRARGSTPISTTARATVRRRAARPRPERWSNICAATARPGRSTPSTGWCRATICDRDPRRAVATTAVRSSFFFGGGRGGFAAVGQPSRHRGSRRVRRQQRCAAAAAAATSAAASGGGERDSDEHCAVLGAVALLAGLASRSPRSRPRRTSSSIETPSVAESPVAQLKPRRSCSPTGRATIWSIRRSASSAMRTGPRRARSSSSSRASIPATPSPMSTSSSTARAAAIARSCICMWRRRASCLSRPPGSLDLAKLATLPFVERIDPAIKHSSSTAADRRRPKEPKVVHNQHPQRQWCEGRRRS